MQNPEDVLDRFAAAWAARDASALAALFVADAEFVNVVGLWWHDREAIREAHDYGFRVIFGESDLRFTQRTHRRIGEDAAVVHGRWQVLGQHTGDGQTAGLREGIFVFVLAETSEGWRVVAAQNTDIINGAESIAVTDGVSVPTDYRP